MDDTCMGGWAWAVVPFQIFQFAVSLLVFTDRRLGALFVFGGEVMNDAMNAFICMCNY